MYRSQCFTSLDLEDSLSASNCSSPFNESTRMDFMSLVHSQGGVSPNALPVVFENGRKVFGPPYSYRGPRPPSSCEVFISHIPEQLDDVVLIEWFQRCGDVYEFRLMMDSPSSTRGYGFVLFKREAEALAACELLNFLFIDGKRLRAFRSQGKNRLFVSNIPKSLPLSDLYDGLHLIFRNMVRCTAYPGQGEGACRSDLNRGYAFVEFEDHDGAMEAKKRTTPGCVRMWGCDLRVQWAKPKIALSPHKLFGGSRQAHGDFCEKHQHPNDFCTKLRLFCLANNWCIPVVVYGRCLRRNGVQYGGILLRSGANGQVSSVLMEVSVAQVNDVHLALCEVVVELLVRSAGFLKYSYLVRLTNAFCAEIVANFLTFDQLQEARLNKYFISYEAIIALSQSFNVLIQCHPDVLLHRYKDSFLHTTPTISFHSTYMFANLRSILPKFRNNPPLNHNLNDAEINLMQIFEDGGHPFFKGAPGTFVNPYATVFSLSSQRGANEKESPHILKFVDVLPNGDSRWFYHPRQRINSPPIWVEGHSYQKSIFQFLK